VVVIGAGAAGLFCAAQAGQRGLKVLLVDHSEKVAEKIRISGGGRCNFTNRDATPANFLSENPHFCRSALSRYTPQDFIELLQRHNIPFHEKHKGQLFCDRSAEDIINMLLAECDAGQVTRWQPCATSSVTAMSRKAVRNCRHDRSRRHCGISWMQKTRAIP
jgi:predicted Rossmann fold flavoprotein